MFLLNKLTSLLPAKLQPYAKALFPAAVTLAGVAVRWITTGDLDTADISAAITGAVASILTFVVPNRP